MPPIHDHEYRPTHKTPVDIAPPWRAALELATLPLLFGLLYLAWPEPRPWWALAGLGWYGGLAAWAVGATVVSQRRA